MANAKDKTSGPAQARRGGILRWLLMGMAGVVVLLLVLVLLLPTLLSTNPGKDMLMRMGGRAIAGSIEAEGVSLRWFGGQSITDLTLRDPEGEPVVRGLDVDAPDVRLLPAMLGNRSFGTIDAQVRDEIAIRQEPGQPTNLQRALALQFEPDDPEEPAELDEDLSVELNVTAQRVTYEGPDVDPVELTDLVAALHIPDIQNMHLELSGDLMHADQAGRIAMDMTVRDAYTADGQPQFDLAEFEGDGDIENFPVAMADGIAQQEGRLLAMLGPTLDARFDAAGPLDDFAGSLALSSEHLSLQSQLAGDADDLRATQGMLEYLLTPQAYAAIMDNGDPPAQLAQPVRVRLELEELILPLTDEGLAWEQGSVLLSGTLGDVLLQDIGAGEIDAVALRDGSFELRSDELAALLEAQFTGQVEAAGESESVTLGARLAHWMPGDALAEAELIGQALPITLVDAIGGQEGRLVELLGSTADLSAIASQTPADNWTFDALLESQNLRAPITGLLDLQTNAIQARTPEPALLTLTQAAYAAWVEPDPSAGILLNETAQLQINIDQLNVALLDDPAEAPAAADDEPAPLRFDPQRTGIVADVRSPRIVVELPATQERYTVDEIVIDLSAPDLRELARIDIEATIEQLLEDAAPQQPVPGQQQPAEPQQDQGQISSSTQLTGLLSDTGELQPFDAAVTSRSTLSRVPSSLVVGLGDLPDAVRAAMGPRTDASLAVDYQPGVGGPVDAELRTDHLQADVPGVLSGDWILGLREDAVLELVVTPELGDELLMMVNPVLNAQSGEQPMVVRVNQQGFAVPVLDFDLATMQATGVAELGTLQVQETTFLTQILGALRTFGVVNFGASFDAEFTPLDFAMTDGVFSYEDDFTMTVDNFVVGFGGQVDLVGDELDMTMWLPGYSLTRMFSDLRPVMRDDDRLEVGIGGSPGDPDLDEGRLATSVARLAAEAAGRDLLPGEAQDVLDILRGRRPAEEPEEEDDEEEEAPRDPLRDIFDMF